MAKILVVEPQPELREALSAVLRRAGHEPVPLARAAEALSRLEGVGLILAGLPLEGAERLTAAGPPALALCPSGGGAGPGWAGSLSRPFEGRQLLEAVGRVLGGPGAEPAPVSDAAGLEELRFWPSAPQAAPARAPAPSVRKIVERASPPAGAEVGGDELARQQRDLEGLLGRLRKVQDDMKSKRGPGV
jgi:hypothetical protein